MHVAKTLSARAPPMAPDIDAYANKAFRETPIFPEVAKVIKTDHPWVYIF